MLQIKENNRLNKGGELREQDVDVVLERKEGPKDGEMRDSPSEALRSKLDEL